MAPSNENRSKKKIGESCLQWFGHVEMRPINALERKSDSIQVKQMKRGKERPKITLVKVVKQNDVLIKEAKYSMIWMDRRR